MRWANCIAGASVIIINYLANHLPINNRYTGQIARQFAVVDYLPDYALLIWWAIYGLLIAFCVYQFEHPQAAGSMGGPFIGSCVFNISWIFAWHFELIPLSLIATLGLGTCLLAGYLRISPYRKVGSWAQLICVNSFFSLYTAWLSITTVANAVVVLDYASWHWFGVEWVLWLFASVISAGVFALAVATVREDPVFPLAFIWVLIAVGLQNAENTLIMYPSAASVFLLLAAVVVIIRRLTLISNPAGHRL